MSDLPVRIPPVSSDALSEEQRALLGGWGSMNFASVIVNHPELYKVLVPLIAKLISATNLPPRDREILVLRTLALCEESYETEHHILIARSAGVSDADIESAQAGVCIEPFDQVLVRAAEELHREQRVSDETWAELARRYSPVELMEVVALVGGYTLMAMVTKSYGIQLEDAETFKSFAEMRQYT